MTVVIDPLGTPEVYPVRDTTAVLDLAGGTAMAPTVIPAVAGKVIVIASAPGGYFIISDDFEIGEVVEIYLDDDEGQTFLSFPVGDTFLGSVSQPIGGSQSASQRVQKVKSSVWTVWNL